MNQNQPAAQQPLAGKRIAVIMESQFIPQELDIYRQRFQSYGATVDFVSHLWGNPKLRFYSTVEPDVVDEPRGWRSASRSMTSSPATMRPLSPWRTTPRCGCDPSLTRRRGPIRTNRCAMPQRCASSARRCSTAASSKGRHATHCGCSPPHRKCCAGAEWSATPWCWPMSSTPEPNTFRSTPAPRTSEQVFVDDDLVTNTGWHATERLVDTIKDIIVQKQHATAPTPAGVTQ